MPDSTIAQEWIKHATSDLRLAETVPASGVLLEHLCFHAQQAAEKALKSVLVSFGIVPPKIHDIDELLSLVGAQIEVPEDLAESRILTDYAVISRYPADFGELDENEWGHAVALARAAVAWADGVVSA